MSNYFTLQLHYEYGVIIDSDAFLGAFTMVKGLKLAPGLWVSDQSTTLPMDYQLVNQEDKRVFMFKKWETYYWHTAGHIPYAVCKANRVPSLGMEDENEDDGESEIDMDKPRRLEGRPLNGKNNHNQDKINVAKVLVV